jgi:hypothetical protein
MQGKIEIPKKEQKEEYEYHSVFITYMDGIVQSRYNPYQYTRHTHTEVVQEEGMKEPIKITYGWTRQGVIFTYKKSKYFRYAIIWKPFRINHINFSGYRFIDTTCLKYGGYHSDCAIDTIDEKLKNIGLNALTPAPIKISTSDSGSFWHYSEVIQTVDDIREIKKYGIDPYEAKEKDRIQLRKEIEIKRADNNLKAKRMSKEEEEEYKRDKRELKTDKLVYGDLGVCMRKFQDRFNFYDSRGIQQDRVKIVKGTSHSGEYGYGRNSYIRTREGEIVKKLASMEDGGIDFCKNIFKTNLIIAKPKDGTNGTFDFSPEEAQVIEERRKIEVESLRTRELEEKELAKKKIQEQIAALQSQLNGVKGGRRTRSKTNAKTKKSRKTRSRV